jgi:hypothetical protein
MSKGGAHTAGSFSLWGLRDGVFRRAIPVEIRFGLFPDSDYVHISQA